MKREFLDEAFLLVVCFPADVIHRFYIGGCSTFIFISLMNIANPHILFYFMKKKNLDNNIHITAVRNCSVLSILKAIVSLYIKKDL